MAYPLQERYINLLTDFGFKRVFGTEPNKAYSSISYRNFRLGRPRSG